LRKRFTFVAGSDVIPIQFSNSQFQIHVRNLAARMTPERCRTASLDSRGRRESRAHSRTRSLACEIEKHTSVVTTPPSSGLPCAMVLTVSFVISPAIGLSCHRRMQVTTCKLDAGVEASGPHDFAVREASASSARRPRPPHPAPNEP
jgi:hypothetical protein